MTFEMVDRKAVFHCDECPEHIKTDEENLVDGLNEIKTKGWRSFRGPDNQWAHSCPVCVAEFAKAKERK